MIVPQDQCILCRHAVYQRGFCKQHFDRWQRNGDPRSRHAKQMVKTKEPLRCAYCERKRVSRGMCNLHYQRWYAGRLPEQKNGRTG